MKTTPAGCGNTTAGIWTSKPKPAGSEPGHEVAIARIAAPSPAVSGS
jgi:hypothetical protein